MTANKATPEELVKRLREPSVLIAGAPGLLEYLPGKPRMGAPDNITAIIQRLEKKCAEAADLIESLVQKKQKPDAQT